MASLAIRDEDFAPGRREEDAAMVGMIATGGGEIGAAGRMIQGGGRIAQAAIEEHRPGKAGGAGAIGERERDRATGEGGRVAPRQRRPVAAKLLRDDAAPRLLDNGMAKARQLGDQR